MPDNEEPQEQPEDAVEDEAIEEEAQPEPAVADEPDSELDALLKLQRTKLTSDEFNAVTQKIRELQN